MRIHDFVGFTAMKVSQFIADYWGAILFFAMFAYGLYELRLAVEIGFAFFRRYYAFTQFMHDFLSSQQPDTVAGNH